MIKSKLGFCQHKKCLRRIDATIALKDSKTHDIVTELRLCKKHFREFQEEVNKRGIELEQFY